MGSKKQKVRFPISFKLIAIVSILVVAALGVITGLVSYIISNDTQVTQESYNLTINSRSASEAFNKINSVRSNTFLLLDMLNSIGSSEGIGRQTTSLFFERNSDIAAILIPGEKELINVKFFLSNEIESDLLSEFIANEQDAITRSMEGETLAINASPFFQIPLIALFYPYEGTGRSQSVIMLFSTDSLTESFGSSSINTSFLVNHDDDILLHADFSLVSAGASMAGLPIVAQMRASPDTSRQLLFTDADGINFFGAYTKLSIGDMAVITTIPTDVVFEAVNATTRRNIYLTIGVLFSAILFIWFWSKTISNPVKRLAEAAHQIEEGKFEISLKKTTNDELGILTESFVSMGKGLAERERLKDTFGRFINKDIAEKAMKGELTLGGETKTCTIFFSDIRGFTAMSESLEPHEVVEFLNDYMTRMVHCVNDTGGVVDKYIGDAIMAVWGTPVSTGTPVTDAYNCVKAALMMRSALMEFNEGRGGPRKPVLKIGCGINTGSVVAGQIGSSERMEYTVIGDAVNFASRTEALNKPMGTDILITENTYNLIKDFVLVEQMPSVTVKGKAEPVKMYAVINIPKATDIKGAGMNGPKTIEEVRTMLGIPTPDILKVDTDAEEKKYKFEAK